MVDRSKYINILFSLALLAVALVCYVLLALLFLDTAVLRLRSLVVVSDPSYITPLVVVGFLAAVLGSATVAFTTRCAEHSLWLRLDPGNAKKPLTIGESRHLAQWSVSPLERVKYLIRGQSIPLKISGILLLATTAAVSPVLLSGISQDDLVDTSSVSQAPTVDVWTPWITSGNQVNRGGSANDIPIFAAALASNDNLSVPAAPVCLDITDDLTTNDCSVSTRSAALFATCTPKTLPNTDNMASTVCSSTPGAQFRNYCSAIVPNLCVNLTCGAPPVFANFLTGPDPSCVSSGSSSSAPSTCNTIPSTWATIFGVWVGGADRSIGDRTKINTVDCTLRYGNVTISQSGRSSPTLDRASFEPSAYLLSEYASRISNVRTFVWRENVFRTPYYFTLRYVGTGFNDIYTSPVAFGLLGDDASHGAEYVARQIERNFDWATLAAFGKGVNASRVTTTRSTTTRVYVYDRRMLAILLVPLLATLLSAWGRLRVGSDEVVKGYDPVAIARMGPVEGLAGRFGAEEKGTVNEMFVRGEREGERVRLVVGQ